MKNKKVDEKKALKMETFTPDQLISAAIKMGYNPQEAKKIIIKTYKLYLKYRRDYNLKKAVKYCILVAPCD